MSNEAISGGRSEQYYTRGDNGNVSSYERKNSKEVLTMNTEKTNRLLDRVAIVTGAGSRDSPNNPDIVGNGRAASILLARAGAFVVLVGMNLVWAQRTQELIDSAPSNHSHGSNRTLSC